MVGSPVSLASSPVVQLGGQWLLPDWVKSLFERGLHQHFTSEAAFIRNTIPLLHCLELYPSGDMAAIAFPVTKRIETEPSQTTESPRRSPRSNKTKNRKELCMPNTNIVFYNFGVKVDPGVNGFASPEHGAAQKRIYNFLATYFHEAPDRKCITEALDSGQSFVLELEIETPQRSDIIGACIFHLFKSGHVLISHLAVSDKMFGRKIWGEEHGDDNSFRRRGISVFFQVVIQHLTLFYFEKAPKIWLQTNRNLTGMVHYLALGYRIAAWTLSESE